MAIVDLVIAQQPDIPVLFLETGYHFPETYAYRDEMTAKLGLNLVNLASKHDRARARGASSASSIRARPTVAAACARWSRCSRASSPMRVWFTALRREQSPTRANLQPVDHFKLPTGKQLLKVSPLADWTNADVWAYLKQRGIPVLPLYDQGYTSIGCAPCTSLPARSRESALGPLERTKAGMRHPHSKRVTPWKSFSAS